MVLFQSLLLINFKDQHNIRTLSPGLAALISPIINIYYQPDFIGGSQTSEFDGNFSSQTIFLIRCTGLSLIVNRLNTYILVSSIDLLCQNVFKHIK